MTAIDSFIVPETAPAALAEHSRFVQRIRRRYAAELPLLPAGRPDRAAIERLIHDLQAAGRALGPALRVARHLVLERLAVLDIEAGAAMHEITEVMTSLAEVTLCLALKSARAEQDALSGAARNEAGEVIEFWVLGMGKLGARELNVSSDIDLIYVYDDDGHTDGNSSGKGSISAHEYFALVAKKLYALIGEVTDDGQVFRVDLALRPNGNSGPAAVSMAMLEEYFLVQGREWERFAWLKSRVVAPLESVQLGRALGLRSLVTPFVYRRYLDYGVFEGLRQLHRKIRDEARSRAVGRPERANDVKLSRGGIREIEFTVQLLQVVRGGQFPEIRTRSTVKALARLAERGLMTAEAAEKLSAAYVFLRQVEHRIQFLDDQQTHCLPSNDEDLKWIARSMGLACKHGAAGQTQDAGTRISCELLDRLGEVREIVANEFDSLLHDGQAPKAGGNGCRSCNGPALPVDSEEFLAKLPTELAVAVRRWADQPRVQSLREESRLRLAKLVGRAAVAVRDEACSMAAALRFVDWIEPLLRRESYLALLVERPAVQSRLLRLLGLARWPMRYLMLHPGVIDELADSRLQHDRFDGAVFLQDLQERHAAWERGGEAHEEALLDTLRRAHQAEVFRTLVRDIEGQITVEEAGDELSALADAILQCTIDWTWARLKQAHRPAPRFAVIAYGKLGGKELGYGGDLDVVFLFDDSDEADKDLVPEIYGAFVRKLITWLTVRTSAGELFDIDTALRPNGNSGMLVTSLASFEKYQTGRGSNTAWTWEHQAITRARFCAGDPALAERFEAVRRHVLTAPRDHAALRQEIQAMRDKVRAAHPIRAGKFDVKHSPGGMMDAEFALQYLVLAHAAEHPALIANAGAIALLQRAEAAGLLPAGVGSKAANAYRELRRAQHKARLDEQPTAVEAADLAALGLDLHRDAMLALWQAVFA
ncbi:bifunctional [glutamate--ammonia ligase]-adenylyl-L-tyrosine phosphorylase/[glutamate--ammonia-ligase] adenylyltransferase [Paucibacter sp. TC2R-5]|uniref:bifunctional [glutamate--ammonia ligase]-adenylyl-L-tyrosine phosphorylase/[glutamate--ammonia-ligase] adenylyltransferase n=1 Tax=Paucibacter sp. TC2R-5 TaxID=2893555 RepID=UPI0021E37F5E|nr:bifunctional [glutamate--ammonia ligase]-adenylyl-L-tyrosine phosphorylase/[glutamate--ammonia-ligase] adenylyltransferase [Paucibacter sp. TC2R-5]MCV2359840.1 bifunctional [glutamate--ammonia ligase]-adenylyl-L-tyrosine phosphorylase/[glutamate--ammonia-ligase] adenylyltransferase [Paucibacter sp. TC2R-5]